VAAQDAGGPGTATPTPAAATAPAPTPAAGFPLRLTIASIAADHQSIVPAASAAAASAPASARQGAFAARAVPPSPPLSLANPGDAEGLADARPGDVVEVQVDRTRDPRSIVRLGEIYRPVPVQTRLTVIAIVAAGLFIAVFVASQGRPRQLVIGADNRYSNSQMQLALWWGVVALAYVSAVVTRVDELGWRYIGGVDLPNNLTVLTGLSALSFGGAKLVSGQKLDAAAEAAVTPGSTRDITALDTGAMAAGGAPAKRRAEKSHLLKDLFQNDAGRTDLGDIQMIFVTLTAVVMFALAAFDWLGRITLAGKVALPDIDTALLSGFGIGQGAYLVKKAATPLGKG
jgi:hypothetical protein